VTTSSGIENNKRLPVGVSDFKDMMTGNYSYVDKTLFIKEVIDRGDKILLLPRPRRFGKTLNLSMLKYFYDCCPETQSVGPETPTTSAPTSHRSSENVNKSLFDSLAIMNSGPEYKGKMGKHPVIFLSFRSIKDNDWETCLDKIKQLLQREYARHLYLLEKNKLIAFEQEYFQRILDQKGSKADYENSLENLLIFLNRYYGVRVVILIDEYDAPVYAGFNNNYYDQVINFMRNFLSSGLKDTGQYLEKCVITGIMRIAKESIFSGLNNPGVYTLLSNSFNDKFGFTEEEVKDLLKELNLSGRFDDVREWYNGYRFGKTIIYNPWSIVSFLADGAEILKPYWVNTSDNVIVDSLLTGGGKELKEELEQLVNGESIEKPIDDNIVLKYIDSYENALWSFLLMGGYLKTTAERMDPATNTMIYTLAIPNLEVRTIYTSIIKRYFENRIENKKLEAMLNALKEGEISVFEEIFSDYVMKSMSFFDMPKNAEKVYHAFVMGLLLWLTPGYRIKSNRESGYGRYDIMIIPKDTSKPGYIIEFKTARKKETVETAIKAALTQIEDKKYDTELIEQGIQNIKKLAIVFKGKDVTVKEG
jgi:hypothetical protein